MHNCPAYARCVKRPNTVPGSACWPYSDVLCYGACGRQTDRRKSAESIRNEAWIAVVMRLSMRQLPNRAELVRCGSASAPEPVIGRLVPVGKPLGKAGLIVAKIPFPAPLHPGAGKTGSPWFVVRPGEDRRRRAMGGLRRRATPLKSPTCRHNTARPVVGRPTKAAAR